MRAARENPSRNGQSGAAAQREKGLAIDPARNVLKTLLTTANVPTDALLGRIFLPRASSAGRVPLIPMRRADHWPTRVSIDAQDQHPDGTRVPVNAATR